LQGAHQKAGEAKTEMCLSVLIERERAREGKGEEGKGEYVCEREGGREEGREGKREVGRET
jgi:hypothetical protein